MTNHVIQDPKKYSDQLRVIQTTDPVHADTVNPLFEKLVNNDAFLREAVELLTGTTIEELKDPEYPHGTVIDLSQTLQSFISTVTSQDGAKTVGMTPLSDISTTADNVADIITALNNHLRSSAGAGHIGVDAIEGVTGRNVQEMLSTLNTKIDTSAPSSHEHTAEDVPALQSHLLDKNNPHNVSKSDVGLGSVLNYGIATEAEAQAGLANNKYMTPLRVGNAIKHLNDHVGNTGSNPHNVTKGQVGLGLVENYGIATQLEAQTGTSTNKYMTPLRVKEAITALQAVKSVAGKTGAVSLVKSDVGLGSVQNYGIATTAEAQAGTSNTKYMTPLRVKEAISSLTGLSTGTGTFPGNGTTKTVSHGLGATPSVVHVMPSANPNGTMGEVWVSGLTSTTFTVGNSGSFTGGFTFIAVK